MDAGITTGRGDSGANGTDASDGGLPPSEAGTPEDAALADTGSDSPPPPPPGKPGFDITAAGNTSTSTHYVLIGALGESPGGNIVTGTSPSYVLKGGVIAGTQ